MPLYKTIAKQQRRNKRKAEQLLSDEESDASDASDASQSDNDDLSASGSDEDSDDGLEEDDGLGGASAAPLDENSPRPPPAGFPTAAEALENPVASTASLIAAMKQVEGEAATEADDEDEEEAPSVCVFCPNKVLKQGKMTEVHLASKDHKRRLARFKAHLESANFPTDHRTADARWVSSMLDKLVLERLSLQTQVGGKKAGTVKSTPASTTSPAKPSTSTSTAAPSSPSSDSTAPAAERKTLASKAALIAAAEEEGTSVREQLRREKKERNVKKRERKDRKAEKNERIKKRKVEAGEKVLPHVPSKPKFVEKIRPTDDEIAQRQAWKKARDEAKAAGKPVPARPVLAYEHGGKIPEGKKVKGGNAVAQKKIARGTGKAEGEKKEKVVNEKRLEKRKEQKERRKAAKKEAAAAEGVGAGEEGVLEEV
ncbi:hypothetical protein JCM11641_006730 [Rhodosporidiobolus odoratus]